ncbi:hypothetical protein [Streptomyces halobius]|uniref:Uncharacterized protein n=1 Tax=Streptomyces halobius TaxID=2879846 RepID=A0ABY4M5N1_9ACTN|nr:hypothetical protein [Streptomyces halobius]UQA92583.1 hypothetical protein K9S39_12790 [Streptomyces halobius]
MHISEANTGAGDLHARSVSLSPRCATDGVVAHGDGERYRAVSITGTWTGLESYLGNPGVGALPATGPENVARERYLGRSTALRPVAGPLEEIFLHRRSSPGRLLFMESRLVAAPAALIDGGAASSAQSAAAARGDRRLPGQGGTRGRGEGTGRREGR